MAVNKPLVTEAELQSATVEPDGTLTFTRESGLKIVAGNVMGATDAQLANLLGTGSLTKAELVNVLSSTPTIEASAVAATEARIADLDLVTAESSPYYYAGPETVGAFVFDDHSIVAKVTADGRTIGGAEFPATATFTAVGDSTTHANNVPVAADRWVNLFSAATGRTVTNLGLSGSRAEERAFVIGAVSIKGSVASIPASGSVNITGLDIDPWRAGATAAVPVDLITDDGTIIEGTFAPSGANRVFTRTTAGAAVTTSTVIIRAAVQTTGTLFVGLGINNEPEIIAGNQTLDQLKSWYMAIARRHQGRLVIWGMLDRGLAEKLGTAIGDLIAALEAWLAATFGDDYYPLRKYLASPQALTDAVIFQPGFTPTGADIAAQAEGTVPPSFRDADTSVHLLALGQKLQARYFQREMSLRGALPPITVTDGNLRLWRYPGLPPVAGLPKLAPRGILDTFTRPDSATSAGVATNGLTWTAVNGVWGISNGCIYSASGTGARLITVDPGIANGTIDVDIDTPADYSGVMFRCIDASNHLWVQNLPGGAIALWKRVGGTSTQIQAVAGQGLVAGDRLTVVLNGSSVVVKRNGATIITATVTDLQAATKYGFRVDSGTFKATRYSLIP